MRAPELRDRPSLAHQAIERRGITLAAQDLQRDPLLGERVPCPIDGTVPALAEQLMELIAIHARPRTERRRQHPGSIPGC